MHSTELGANTVPAFLTKLWKLVEDGSCDDLICWGPNGMSFIIRNQAQFSKELLPLYFKHNNMASFIRQLNMYGFRKVANIEQGGLRAEKDEMEFQHQYFVKGQDYLLILIKRKIPTGKGNEEIKVRTEIVNRMLADMKQLKGHQESFDGKLQNMKRENEALWREVANLRQKHIKQQQIVNKLIHFLLTLVQPNHSIGMKRKIPLMFNENSHPHESKTPCLSRHLSYDGDKSCKKQNENNPSNHNPGPVIHEVTDLLEVDKTLGSDDNNIIEVTVNTDPIPSSSSTTVLPSSLVAATTTIEDPVALAAAEAQVPTTLDELVSEFPLTDKSELPCSPAVASVADASMDLPVKIESPSMSSENQSIDCNDEPTTIPLDAALESVIGNDPEPLSTQLDSTNEVALFSGSDPEYSKSLRSDLSSYVENIQNELETLRETLAASGCNINASALLGVCSGSLMSSLLDEAQLFTPDDSLPSSSISDQGVGDDKNEIIGTELIQYNPSLLELTDEDFFGPDASNSSIDDGTVLFDNVEAILPELSSETDLVTPDPLLCSPNLAPSKKRGRPKKMK